MNVFYRGLVRTGSFGKHSTADASVYECGECGARYLPPMMADVNAYYQSADYRNDLEQGNTVEKAFALSDNEQPQKLDLLGAHAVRNQVVADIGSGAGSFLDLARGMAAKTIAVDPNPFYHASLKERGHATYSSVGAALEDWRGRVDIAVSFSVVEHVERPREFLAEIKALLKPDGKCLVSTPNASDFLLELCPAYAAFFYRKAHLWYFTPAALRNLATKSGFTGCEIKFKHRFDLSNCLVWLRDQRPSGVGAITLDAQVNSVWARSLELAGKSDYLYALAS